MQPFELLSVLAFSCPKLKVIELTFFYSILEGALKQTDGLRNFKHLRATTLQQALISLPLDAKITLTISVRRDEIIFPLILHVAAFTKKIDTLFIDRGTSDEGCSAFDQGWQKDTPLCIKGRSVAAVTKPILEVRSIQMTSIGRNSRYIMPLLETTGLREISIIDCSHIEFILQPLIQSALLLTSFSVTFSETQADFAEAAGRYHHLKVDDYRYAFDFVRAGNFTLTSLTLWMGVADKKRRPKSSSLLVPNFWFAIQAHMATLIRLVVCNEMGDFHVTDIEELGRCAPQLQELRITAGLGDIEIDEPTPRTEGLTVTQFILLSCIM